MAHFSNVLPFHLRTCRYLLTFSYIGTRYNGVQRQTRRITEDDEDGTIQAAIEKAVNRALCPVYACRLALSSRTDSGVHAYMNTANVDLTHPLPETIYKPSFITHATNRILFHFDHEITIVDTRLVPSHFHSRINAKWRSYVYRVAVIENDEYKCFPQQVQFEYLRPYLPLSQINRCHIVSSLDMDLVRKSCQLLQGEHDFVMFASKSTDRIDKSTCKLIQEFKINPLNYDEICTKNRPKVKIYEFFIKSQSFLYNQVRRMVSAVIDVGLGRINLKELEQMLQPPFQKPKMLSTMVPACGLYLYEVGYDEKEFIINDDDFNEYAPREHFNRDLLNEP